MSLSSRPGILDGGTFNLHIGDDWWNNSHGLFAIAKHETVEDVLMQTCKFFFPITSPKSKQFVQMELWQDGQGCDLFYPKTPVEFILNYHRIANEERTVPFTQEEENIYKQQAISLKDQMVSATRCPPITMMKTRFKFPEGQVYNKTFFNERMSGQKLKLNLEMELIDCSPQSEAPGTHMHEMYWLTAKVVLSDFGGSVEELDDEEAHDARVMEGMRAKAAAARAGGA